jgi:hypothetical protein
VTQWLHRGREFSASQIGKAAQNFAIRALDLRANSLRRINPPSRTLGVSILMPASKWRTEMSDELTPPHIHDAEGQVRRRKLLALLLASPFLPASWRAMAQGAAAAGTAAAVGEKFMTLSVFATGRPKLDGKIGAALSAALRESDATFAAAVDDLAADTASGKYSDVESLEAEVRGTPKHAALLALVSAWYTGSVSINGKERFITLQDALMYQPIADGSHIPGLCAGATNSWADQTAPSLAAMPSDR